jgi:hypothetical protein
MPTWGEILAEIQRTRTPQGAVDLDGVRRKYLRALSEHTGRPTILYATRWTSPGANPEMVSISPEDVQGLMEVVHGLKGDKLDLILHSPGGSAEAAEAMVNYLRTKFKHIRAIVPHAAMSAATMLACACNEIVMGKHSSLGPIDPQFILATGAGPQAVPAQAILDQFEMAKEECKDPQKLGTWIPILQQYGPGLLVQSRNALKLSDTLVHEWLREHMFAGDKDAEGKAAKIAAFLNNHEHFKSHGRYIPRDKLEKLGVRVVELEKDQKLQDLVLACYHSATHTFSYAPHVVKLFENNLGKAFVKMEQSFQIIPQLVKLPNPPEQLPPGGPGQ